MEFHEKLQALRKQKGWTQEELAERLFVSRTAVSKWESGRGYPGIESLKALSKVYAVSIDELLSGAELLDLAETEQKQQAAGTRDVVYGILDCMTALLYLLPVFAQEAAGKVITVPLLAYTENHYIFISYLVLTVLTILFGIALLALQNWQNYYWRKSKTAVSLALTLLALLFALMNRQPYPGTFWLSILLMKGIVLVKR